MKEDWLCIEVPVRPADADECVALLWELGTVGLEEIPGADGLTLKAFFAGSTDEKRLLRRLKASARHRFAGDLKTFRQQSNPDDWIQNYKRNFHAFPVGKTYYIHPSWEPPSANHAINLQIDPGHAFGTGTHESTQLCLCALEKAVPGATSLADVGTGSGILAIAARKLSRSLEIAALDIDLQAVEMARENIRINQAERILLFSGTTVALNRSFELVVANLSLGILQQTAADLARVARGKLIVSGFTVDQAHLVSDLFGLRCHDRWETGGWACLSFVPDSRRGC